ncbi:MAG TPA: polysaccharide pyruvyl transferase family protein [Chlamydiales bacterium]|nr:polysaccharide pyruvyl transferase family protein [Chlamydiales bacterium]
MIQNLDFGYKSNLCRCSPEHSLIAEEPALFYWHDGAINFGDFLSRVIVERIVGKPLRYYVKKTLGQKKKLLAIGSILYFANTGDIVWGSGINGKTLDKKFYGFAHLDIRAVRGPLTRNFLMEQLRIPCPEIYGDPALLFPYLFPEFKKKENPAIDYLIIPHYTDEKYFPKSEYENVVYTSDPWNNVVKKILDSKFVISSSLHGIVIAESFGIPARLLRVSNSPHNQFFKFEDYYLGTNRPHFQFASSIEEALQMQGEIPFECDLQKLYNAFPKELFESG